MWRGRLSSGQLLARRLTARGSRRPGRPGKASRAMASPSSVRTRVRAAALCGRPDARADASKIRESCGQKHQTSEKLQTASSKQRFWCWAAPPARAGLVFGAWCLFAVCSLVFGVSDLPAWRILMRRPWARCAQVLTRAAGVIAERAFIAERLGWVNVAFDDELGLSRRSVAKADVG